MSSFLSKMIEIRDSGMLVEMHKRGLIDHKPTYYLDIYIDKASKGLTYSALAQRLGVSRSTVLRAVRSIASKPKGKV